MRFACLGSGSEGNALVVQSASTTLLVDCGFGLAETESRLARVGLSPTDISAILITHEHGDHVGGAARFAAKHQRPVWMTHGTWAASPLRHLSANLVHIFDSHTAFDIEAVLIQPFPVPHDAREPAQFVFGNGDVRLGLLTDVGSVTPHIERMLSGCNALMLECNHDSQLLRDGSYPMPLKGRIASRVGHLDNATAAQLLRTIATDRLSCVVAAHLSDANNRPELARASLGAALDCAPDWIAVADQAQGLDWRAVGG